MRIARQDMAVDGFRVEAGSMLMVGVYAMHRDPQLWYRPMEFDPDRFTAGRHPGCSGSSAGGLAVGRGRASASSLALTAATLELASIVRHCRLTSRSATVPDHRAAHHRAGRAHPALVQTVNA